MSKGTKLTALPKLDEWKAPWEVTKDASGATVEVPDDEQVIDKAQLKKYVYGLLNDKITIRNSLDETTAEAEALQQKLVEAKTPEELTALQQENVRLAKERDDAKKAAEGSADSLKWEIALEKGLTKSQAKRLVGKNREELEADADELITEFGSAGKPAEEDGDSGVRSAPKRRVTTAGDPGSSKDDEKAEADPDEVAKAWLARR